MAPAEAEGEGGGSSAGAISLWLKGGGKNHCGRKNVKKMRHFPELFECEEKQFAALLWC